MVIKKKEEVKEEKKPVKTIQDAYLEVFFKGYQVRKNITPIPVEKETQRTLVKDVSEDLNRELKNDFIKRKTQREHTLDPLDIKKKQIEQDKIRDALAKTRQEEYEARQNLKKENNE